MDPVGVDWIGLIRHGESSGNVAWEAAEAAGHDVVDLPERDADVPLSPEGERQGKALGRWFASMPREQWPDLVVSSPYLRALDTAHLAVPGHSRSRVDERLRDRELGVFDVLTKHGVARRYPEEPARERRLGKFYYRPPGGESWADVALRLRSLLRDLDGRRVLLFGHEITAFLLRYLLEGLPERDLTTFARNMVVPNGSLTSWRREEGLWVLERESETGHLVEEGAEPTADEDAATAV
ncbi:broad specificity phosphatase PhoE [Saccharothrix ecbatanensis]|uniref:Broad specificity phosphatase PhoE n=1 Tax=Saccharothrix ecbatanensis TaxID=1105145 RepID=A0A7W9HUI9_9PSEU|nr:histidine phosphatase family protein [Saccharothrix ecbatanensis]MBB5808757.1 broad specificity phosphatase PhoE [Saccharothrix ecbatanensis]